MVLNCSANRAHVGGNSWGQLFHNAQTECRWAYASGSLACRCNIKTHRRQPAKWQLPLRRQFCVTRGRWWGRRPARRLTPNGTWIVEPWSSIVPRIAPMSGETVGDNCSTMPKPSVVGLTPTARWLVDATLRRTAANRPNGNSPAATILRDPREVVGSPPRRQAYAQWHLDRRTLVLNCSANRAHVGGNSWGQLFYNAQTECRWAYASGRPKKSHDPREQHITVRDRPVIREWQASRTGRPTKPCIRLRSLQHRSTSSVQSCPPPRPGIRSPG